MDSKITGITFQFTISVSNYRMSLINIGNDTTNREFKFSTVEACDRTDLIVMWLVTNAKTLL